MRTPEPDGVSPDAAFAAFYGRELRRVVTVLAAVCGEPGLAEEAAAEAFARAYARWPAVRDMDSPAAWVHTVALNEVRGRFRRRRLEQRWLARQRPVDAPPPQEPRTELWAAVRRLPPRARTAVALRYVADLTEAQTAAVMGVSPGTVARTLSRARHRLAQELAPGPSEGVLP